jgi:hypothetical protein
MKHRFLFLLVTLATLGGCGPDCGQYEFEELGDCRDLNTHFVGTWRPVSSECTGGNSLTPDDLVLVATGQPNRVRLDTTELVCYDENTMAGWLGTDIYMSANYTLTGQGTSTYIPEVTVRYEFMPYTSSTFYCTVKYRK